MPAFNAESPDLRQLYLDLKAADGNLQVLLRRAIKEAAQSVADKAKADAGAWSTRIPAAVLTKVSFTQRSTGVSVEVNGKKAPHARPIDHGGKGGTFRHRVFGTDTWVEQPARPFFASAVDAKDPEISRRILKVADDLARQAGFTD